MTIMNVAITPGAAYVVTDSAMHDYAPGVMGRGYVGSDPVEVARALAERRAAPAAPPLRRLLNTEKFVVGAGRRVVTAGSRFVEPLTDWLAAVRALPTPTFDEVSALAPGRLAAILGRYPRHGSFVVLVAGWSEARGRVVAEVHGSDAGLAPAEVKDWLFGPWPWQDDPEYDARLDPYLSRPPAELRHPPKAMYELARNQARGYAAGVYGAGGGGGRLWLHTVTRAGVRTDVLADLDQEEAVPAKARDGFAAWAQETGGKAA